MLRIRPLSDLHLDKYEDGGVRLLDVIPDDLGEDVVIIAGDLCEYDSLENSLNLISKKFESKRILYVSGNHEAYKSSIAQTEKRIQSIIDDNNLDNIDYLNNSIVHIGPGMTDYRRDKEVQRFLGCTLWFPYRYGYPELSEWAMSDFDEIMFLRERVGDKNRESIKFLEDNVKPTDIVITHHLPTRSSVPPRFERSNINAFFIGGADHIIRYLKPKLWFHGHSHSAYDYIHESGTREIRNPVGYPREGYESLNETLIIEVPYA